MIKNKRTTSKTIHASYPEELLELSELERKYPNWDQTPEEVKFKMTALAFSVGGGEALLEGNNQPSKYALYLSDLYHNRYITLAEGTQEDIDSLEDKMSWLIGRLQNPHKSSERKTRDAWKRYARYYVEIRYMNETKGVGVLPAAKSVAKKLGESDYKSIRARYYEFKKKYDQLSLDEIIQRFDLDVIL